MELLICYVLLYFFMNESMKFLTIKLFRYVGNVPKDDAVRDGFCLHVWLISMVCVVSVFVMFDVCECVLCVRVLQ